MKEQTWCHFLPSFSPAGVYPVDVLEDDPEGYRKAALAYYARLREGAQPSTEVFSLPTGEQVWSSLLVESPEEFNLLESRMLVKEYYR